MLLEQSYLLVTSANVYSFFSPPDPDKDGSCSAWKWCLSPLLPWRLFVTRNVRNVRRLSISQKNWNWNVESLTDSDTSFENHQGGFTELQTLTWFLCINWWYSQNQQKVRSSEEGIIRWKTGNKPMNEQALRRFLWAAQQTVWCNVCLSVPCTILSLVMSVPYSSHM